MRTALVPTVPAWPYTAAALLSFAAFWLGDGPAPFLPVFALGLLAVYVAPVRVERGVQTAWFARLALFGLAFALNAGHEPQLQDTWITAPGMNFVGSLLTAELVLRAWHSPPNTRQMLFLSALMVLFGCATSDERVGLYLVPPYFFCVILALRSDRARVAEAPRLAPVLRRAAAVALVFVIGGLAQWSFRAYRSQIVEWGSAALGDRLRPASAEVSGIAKDPTLGPTFGSPGSSTRILRVVGSFSDPHLHGMAFDTYVRGAWMPTLGNRRFEAATPTDLGADTPGPRVQITRFVDDDGMVSAPLASAGIVLDPDAQPTWAREQGGPVRHETSDALSYQVVLGPTDESQGPLCASPSRAERLRCLAVPAEIDLGVRVLAQQIAGRLPTPRQRVEAVQDYLLTHYAYSLQTDPGRGDAVSNFLLQHKAAHCEYFASSAAILLRCVGVPTRYAIGYYAHEGAGSGVTVVRGQDAHAWAESWIDGTGWVVVDATPGNGRPDHTAKTPFWWKLRDRWQDLTLTLQTGFARLSGPSRLLLLAGLFVLLAARSAVRARRGRRASPASVFAYAPPPLGLTELASRFEAWLARRGIPCPPDRPWQEHLALIAQGEIMGKGEGEGPRQWEGGQARGPASTGDLRNPVGAAPCGRTSSTGGLLSAFSHEAPPMSVLLEGGAFVAAYNRARFGADDDPQAHAEAAEALRRLEQEA